MYACTFTTHARATTRSHARMYYAQLHADTHACTTRARATTRRHARLHDARTRKHTQTYTHARCTHAQPHPEMRACTTHAHATARRHARCTYVYRRSTYVIPETGKPSNVSYRTLLAGALSQLTRYCRVVRIIRDRQVGNSAVRPPVPMMATWATR